MEYIKNYWYHECTPGGDNWVKNENKKCIRCNIIQPYPFTVNSMKTVYNWFHFAFPDYKNNEICTTNDILLRDDFEEWLVNAGE